MSCAILRRLSVDRKECPLTRLFPRLFACPPATLSHGARLLDCPLTRPLPRLFADPLGSSARSVHLFYGCTYFQEERCHPGRDMGELLCHWGGRHGKAVVWDRHDFVIKFTWLPACMFPQYPVVTHGRLCVRSRALARSSIPARSSARSPARAPVRSSARPSARPPVRSSARPSARPLVRSSVRPPVRASVRPFARPLVRPSAHPSVRSPVRPSVRP